MPLSRPAGLLISEKTCHVYVYCILPNKSQKNPTYIPLLIYYPEYLALHDYLAGKVGMFNKDLVKLCIERRSFRTGFTPLHSTAQYSEQ